jgi:hypothetical protein
MAKLDCCQYCEFYAHSLYMVCAEHPAGVVEDSCPDFALDLEIPDDDATAWYGEPWQPEGASYYGGELVLDRSGVRSLDEQLYLLDTHPLFTGRCPACEMPLIQTDPPRVHWDCEHCGWVDDSV